jgi:AcrR family transcriptional regulator
MSRWEPNARGRLEQAALELYAEQGFHQTTVAEIAERAGLTERTFFRYFADKREVLFSGSELLTDLLTRTAAGTPHSATPMDAAAAGLDAIGARLQERHAFARMRSKIIAVTPELQERELIKLASMAGALAGALREHGVAEPAASLVAEVAIVLFRIAFECWVEETNQSELPQLIRRSLDELEGLTGKYRRSLPSIAQPGGK